MTYFTTNGRRVRLILTFVAAIALALIVLQLFAQRAETQSEAPGSAQEATFTEDNERDFASGKIIVKLEEDATQRDLRELNRENDARTEDDLPRSDLNVIDLPNDIAVREGVEIYEDSPDIEYAEPDFILEPSAMPNDPGYGSMYGLNNTGQTGGTSGADTDAPEAWDISTGKSSTVVAVIDEGVDVNHPDLDDNLWVNTDEIPGNGVDDDKNGYVDDVNGYDFANNDASVYDPDILTGEGDEHGTHVAGTIAAEGNNGGGVTGVNWDAQIMSLKFLGVNGGFTSDAVEAINYAVNNGSKISNNSWGGGGDSQALRDAIANADSKGHLFVAAAGNGGSDGVGDDNDATPAYPASYDNSNIISVAATDDDDGLASFSNFGAKSVDLGAPGVGILSTLPDNSYARYSGTSMATPHVSGVAALIKSENPGFDDAKLKSQILGTAETVSSLNGKTLTGGRLNSAQALGIRFTELSLSASPQTLKIGAGTTLSGGLTTTSGDALGDRQVILQQRPVGGSFANAGQTTTASDGKFEFSGVKPQKHTDYRAYFPGNSTDKLEPSTSAIRRVNVQVAVSLATNAMNLKLGNARPVVGAVNPSHAGSSVTLTIKRNGSVIARRSVALNQDSRYRFNYKPTRLGTYAFFATFPKDNDHFGNRSPQKSFKVVR